ncbi:hypothetical protein GCM10010236_58170 [Streptomyces eurythermus]|nr:hypothetical protein GCM10010236_58170 [Streptomyces eurythermus]
MTGAGKNGNRTGRGPEHHARTHPEPRRDGLPEPWSRALIAAVPEPRSPVRRPSPGSCGGGFPELRAPVRSPLPAGRRPLPGRGDGPPAGARPRRSGRTVAARTPAWRGVDVRAGERVTLTYEDGRRSAGWSATTVQEPGAISV